MTVTVTTTPGQSKPGSNAYKEVLHLPQSSRTLAPPSDHLISCLGHSLFYRDAVGVFYSLSRLSCVCMRACMYEHSNVATGLAKPCSRKQKE